MLIYGVTLLSVSFFAGLFLGDVIGKVIGINSNVGGVGIAMVILIMGVNYLTKRNKLSSKAQEGIAFWSGMYIPIVVAMTANQNVIAAVKGGPAAIIAGLLATVISFALIPFVSKIGKGKGGNFNKEKGVDNNA